MTKNNAVAKAVHTKLLPLNSLLKKFERFSEKRQKFLFFTQNKLLDEKKLGSQNDQNFLKGFVGIPITFDVSKYKFLDK
uniref:Uncharacterized protein n=1 Tax=Romanomermis culicivorax TaxID=13658 RepID=A0A915JK41_ROMCU